MDINKAALDRHITGNYGEDQSDAAEGKGMSDREWAAHLVRAVQSQPWTEEQAVQWVEQQLDEFRSHCFRQAAETFPEEKN